MLTMAPKFGAPSDGTRDTGYMHQHGAGPGPDKSADFADLRNGMGLSLQLQIGQ